MTDAAGSHDFVYVHTDIPDGMTIREWRAHCSTCVPRERQAARDGSAPALGSTTAVHDHSHMAGGASPPTARPRIECSSSAWQPPRNRRTAGEGVRVVLGPVRQP